MSGSCRCCPPKKIFDLLATRLDPAKVGDARAAITFVFPESGERMTVSIANGVLIHRAALVPRADATVTLKRADLVAALIGAVALARKITSGELRIERARGVSAHVAG